MKTQIEANTVMLLAECPGDEKQLDELFASGTPRIIAGKADTYSEAATQVTEPAQFTRSRELDRVCRWVDWEMSKDRNDRPPTMSDARRFILMWKNNNNAMKWVGFKG